MKMLALGGFSRVISVYHRVNQTCESQEADQTAEHEKTAWTKVQAVLFALGYLKGGRGSPRRGELHGNTHG